MRTKLWIATVDLEWPDDGAGLALAQDERTATAILRANGICGEVREVNLPEREEASFLGIFPNAP